MLAAHGTRKNPVTGAFEPPSASKLGRLLALPNADELGACLSAWLVPAALDRDWRRGLRAPRPAGRKEQAAAQAAEALWVTRAR